jgi:hypothetical protein
MTGLLDGCQKYGDHLPSTAGLVPNRECACIHFPEESATWTLMWSILKTKALSPSGTIVWSCCSIDRYCQRRPKLLIQLALLSTWPLECTWRSRSSRRRSSFAASPDNMAVYRSSSSAAIVLETSSAILVSIIVAGATIPTSVARFRKSQGSRQGTIRSEPEGEGRKLRPPQGAQKADGSIVRLDDRWALSKAQNRLVVVSI